jgi:hypothetical protein
MIPCTGLDITTAAFMEIGAFAPGESIPSEDTDWAFDKLGRLGDEWNAEEATIYATDFLTFILKPNIQPLTIGQAVTITATQLTSNTAIYTGRNDYVMGETVSVDGCVNSIYNVLDSIVTFANDTRFELSITNADIPLAAETDAKAIFSTPDNDFPDYAMVNNRPTTIADANIILNNVSPTVRSYLRIRDKDWWMANSVRQTTTTLPTDLYYDPKFPNGEINLWPLQTFAYGLELEVWGSLSDLASPFSQFWMPPGYKNAVIYNLAVSLIPSYGKGSLNMQRLMDLADGSLAKIKSLNLYHPRITTADAGIPTGRRAGSFFNWLNGQVVPGK